MYGANQYYTPEASCNRTFEPMLMSKFSWLRLPGYNISKFESVTVSTYSMRINSQKSNNLMIECKGGYSLR